MLILVNSQPLPVKPSLVAGNRSAGWEWVSALQAKGVIKFFYPKPGRGAVGVFEVDSPEELQVYLTEWAEFVPCTYEVTMLIDPDFQKTMLTDASTAAE